jgi:hypothetical protein
MQTRIFFPGCSANNSEKNLSPNNGQSWGSAAKNGARVKKVAGNLGLKKLFQVRLPAEFTIYVRIRPGVFRPPDNLPTCSLWF